MDMNITELIDKIYNDTIAQTTALTIATAMVSAGVATPSIATISTGVSGSSSSTITTISSMFDQPTVRNRNTTITSSNNPPWVVWLSSGRVQIPLYATILLLAVIGNGLVILTLVQNRRMRTITNVFLLNLAVSDILLGVLCMPFTLIGSLLRDFVFGEIMCKFLPYLQGKYNTC